MSNLKNISICLILVFIHSCKKVNFKENFLDKEGFEIIEVKESDKVEFLKESEFIKKIDFIRLETKPECIIGKIDKIVIDANYIYVLDKYITESLFVFKKNGEFIKKLGSKGKGPEECVSINDFVILKDDKVVLLDNGGRKIMFFDKLNYIHSKRTNDFEYIIELAENDLHYYFKSPKGGRKKAGLVITNQDLKVLEESFLIPPKSKKILTINQYFKNYKDSISLIKPFESKIFRIKGTTITPKYYFDFGDNQLSYEVTNFPKNFQEDWKGFHFLEGSFYESEGYILFGIYLKTKYNWALYNKSTGVLKYTDILLNDLVIGAVSRYIDSNDEFIFGSIEAVNIDYIKSDIKEKYGLTHVNENDNPIITLSYFK